MGAIQPLALRTSLIFILTLVGGPGVRVVRADQFVFVLHNGGRVSGKWLNLKQPPHAAYLVQIDSGGRISLDHSQVKSLIRRKPDEVQYDRIAPNCANTVEAQWELAEWCRQRRLLPQRAAHLRQIIQLDPDNVKARHGLGYMQIGNGWMTRDQWLKAQGYVFYRGRWYLEQEIDLLEAESQKENAEQQWLGKLKRLHQALTTDRAAQAQQQILGIRDPNAVRALRENLYGQRSPQLKLVYIRLLGQIGNRDALVTLINASLNLPDIEVFHACVEEVVRLQSLLAVSAYIRGLQNHNNVRVNRSANALGRIGNQKAIAPLIDALVTTHQKVVYPQSNRGSGLPISTTFALPCGGLGETRETNIIPAYGSGGTSFVAGGGPHIVSIQVPNKEVLAALATLTDGVSFGFDQTAWKNWLAVQRSHWQTPMPRTAP